MTPARVNRRTHDGQTSYHIGMYTAGTHEEGLDRVLVPYDTMPAGRAGLPVLVHSRSRTCDLAGTGGLGLRPCRGEICVAFRLERVRRLVRRLPHIPHSRLHNAPPPRDNARSAGGALRRRPQAVPSYNSCTQLSVLVLSEGAGGETGEDEYSDIGHDR